MKNCWLEMLEEETTNIDIQIVAGAAPLVCTPGRLHGVSRGKSIL